LVQADLTGEGDMDLMHAQAAYESGQLTEAADGGNGWMVILIDTSGGREKLTDHSGIEKVYHDLDHATEAAKKVGAIALRIEEPF
jgi:hypothetical protein